MGLKFSQLPIASSVAADDYIAVLDSSESVLKRTPISHASAGTEYGVATTSAYGHTKIVDNLSQSSLTSGEALSSRQGNVIANDMGVVELSTKAAHAHAVGDFFMLIGQFVKCTKAIAVGNTINIGTNVATTNIGEVLSQLNSKVGSSSLQSGKTLTSIVGSTPIDSSLGTTLTAAVNALNSKNSGNKVLITVTCDGSHNWSHYIKNVLYPYIKIENDPITKGIYIEAFTSPSNGNLFGGATGIQATMNGMKYFKTFFDSVLSLSNGASYYFMNQQHSIVGFISPEIGWSIGMNNYSGSTPQNGGSCETFVPTAGSIIRVVQTIDV